MKKAYIRLDKIGSDARLESAVAKEALRSGQFVELGKALDEAEGEAVEVEKTKAGARPEAVLAPVFIDYGELDFDITERELKAGKAGRAVILEAGQILSFNKEIATGELKVGDDVTVGEDGLGIKKSNGSSDKSLGKVIRMDYLNFIGDLVTIRVK